MRPKLSPVFAGRRRSGLRALAFLMSWSITVAQSAFAGEPGKCDVMGDPLPRFALQRLGTTWFRTAEEVTCLRLSPDSSRILLAVKDFWGSDRNSALIYDTVSGKLVQTLSRHEHPVHGVDYSPDGSLIASAGFDGAIRIWDPKSAKLLRTLSGPLEPPHAVAFSSDGSQLFSAHAGDGSAHVWDRSTGSETRWLRPTEEFPSSMGFLAVSPDGRTLATDDMDNVILWRLPATRPMATLKGHEYAVKSIAFSPDGKTLASGSLDRTVRLWDVESHRTAHILRHEASVHAVSYSRDGRRLAAGGDGGDVVLWDTATRTIEKRLPGHVGAVQALSFSRDGRLLVTAGDGKTIRVWDLQTGNCSLPDVGHLHALSFIAFSQRCGEVVTASLDGTIRKWDSESGRELRRFAAHRAGSRVAAISPDGTTLATVDADEKPDTPRRLTVWDLDSGRPLVECKGNFTTAPYLSFAPGGQRLVVAAPEKSVWVFDVATGKLITRRRFHPRVVALAISPTGGPIVLIDRDSSVHILDATTLETVRQFPADPLGIGGPLAFSPDGKKLAIADTKEAVTIWDIGTLEPILGLRGGTKWVNDVAWSRDGHFIATGADDATVRLWDAATGQEVVVLAGHEEPVTCVAFSRDGSKLASCSGETWALVWDLRPFMKGM
jgi:WD40 repeat protein